MVESYTVSGVNAYLRSLVDNDLVLQDIWVAGEVSNVKKASSGHWYFTLKDRNAQLRAAMFRQAAERGRVNLRDGDAIEARGRVSFYDARGDIQLYVEEIRTGGQVGDLYERFEQLKQALDAEGLFDAARKRPVPAFPKRLGIVTSPDAAALRDVLNVLRRRFPLVELLLSPTLVQGPEAPPMIVRALGRLYDTPELDAIILCRGGGSIEDLWAFNDERVARAIVASPCPIISGVGHETDFTIADFVADLRAPTPSAAAELATPDSADLAERLMAASQSMQRSLSTRVQQRQQQLNLAERTLRMRSPEAFIIQMRQRIDDDSARMQRQQQQRLGLLNERLKLRLAALEAANPAAILGWGYAIVRRSEDGQILRNPAGAAPGTGLSIRLHEGEIKARVEDEEQHGRYKRTLL